MVINRDNLSLLNQHAGSYWIDCLVYSRSFVLPPAVFTPAVFEAAAIQRGIQLLVSSPPVDTLQFLRDVITNPADAAQQQAACVLFGCGLLLAKNHQEAVQVFEGFASDFPLDCHFPYYLALCQIKLHQAGDAVGNLEKSIRLAPDFASAWGAIGLIAGLMRDHTTALQACDKALAAGYEIGNQLLSLCQFQARIELGLLPFRNQHFDSRFFEPITHDEHLALLHQLPDVQHGYHSAPVDDQRPLLFCAADNTYFHDYVVPLALSLIATGSVCTLHVHVFNPDAFVESKLIALAEQSDSVALRLSFEEADIAAIAHPSLYYSCIRFCRFYQATDSHQGLSVMVDADALFRKPLQALLSTLDNQPKPVVEFLPAEPIWQEVCAAFLLIDSTQQSREFLSFVSSSILRHIYDGIGRWFLDQVALQRALVTVENVSRLSLGRVACNLVADLNYSDESFVWVVANDKFAKPFVKYRDDLFAASSLYWGDATSFTAEIVDSRLSTRSSTVTRLRDEQNLSPSANQSDPSVHTAMHSAVALDGQLVEALLAFLTDSHAKRLPAASTLDVIHFHLALLFAYRSQFKLHAAANGCVLSGPFTGMRMPLPVAATKLQQLQPVDGGSANISAFLLGVYEGELHDSIESLLAKRDYDVIVDIGCSIGYYAVGLALRQPQALVLARDTNDRALAYVHDLALANDVHDRVQTGGLWHSADFEALSGRRCLVFCDIEGAELELLDPSTAPSLVDFDIIVEMHDVFNPTISRQILDRFSSSHDIVFIPNGSHRAPVPAEIGVLTMHEAAIVLSELRSGPTPWAVMSAKRQFR